MTEPFESRPAPRLVFGAGSVERLGELARDLGARRVLFVTDPGIVAAGHAPRGVTSLERAGLEVHVHDLVRENPTTDDVDACCAAARAVRPDLLVGFGGGSSMDVAKGANFVLAGGGRMHDYWGVGKARGTLLPLIAVPTTAGTGSEMQSFALVADVETHQKMACGDPRALPRAAVLDPELTTTQPSAVTACTGLDAIGHAVETAVTRKRTPISRLYSFEAFRLADAALPRVLADPGDVGARGDMLLAAAFAGRAIENSMLGGAHSMSNPLTARFAIAHGQAVGMALPWIVRFNAQDPEARDTYAGLARAAGHEASAEALAARLVALLELAGLPTSLAACGISPGDAPALADEAARQWTAQFNPRAVGAPEFRELFERASA